METLAKINKPAQQRSVVQSAPGGKLLPAVGVLQKKGGPEEELPAQGQFIVQKAGMPDEEPLQKKGGPEEELPAQGKFVLQKAGMPEEEPLQKKGGPEEELPAQGKFVLQKATMPGEEPLQKKGDEEELPAQGKFVVQKEAMPEEEAVQGKFVQPVQQKKKSDPQTTGLSRFNPVQRKANNTGLPDNLKSGIENMSGFDMSDVKVHYNSSKPAQLNAHAYAQGTDIHIAPGQEKHLPHEAWHVIQQKQGRVKATMQMKGGVPVNDNAGLEHEADTMGGKAMQLKEDDTAVSQRVAKNSVTVKRLNGGVVQRFSSADITLAAFGNVAKAPNRIGAARLADSGASIHQVSIDNIAGAGTFVDGAARGARVDKQGEFAAGSKTYANIQVQANSPDDVYADLAYPAGTPAGQKGTSLAEVHIDTRITGSTQQDILNRGNRLLKQGLFASRGDRATYPRRSYRITC